MTCAGSGFVQTVNGPIPPESVGITLIHEHLHLDATGLVQTHGYEADDVVAPFDSTRAAECRWNPAAHPDNYRFDETEAILDDLIDAASLGVRTVVDATPVDLGRNASALREISRRSGVNVVMGTGFYLAATHRRVLPEGREEDATFDLITGEHAEGVDGTRPGMIGEIGTSDPPRLSEMAVLRGAARAAVATGLSLTVHVHPWGLNGDAVVTEVAEVGLEPGRLILNHMNTAVADQTYLHGLLGRGVVLAFDLFGFDHSLLGAGRYPPSDDEAASAIADLVREGHSQQIVLSQDVGVRTRLRSHGGWGYGHLLRHVVPLLAAKGVDSSDIDQMLVANTRRLLTIA